MVQGTVVQFGGCSLVLVSYTLVICLQRLGQVMAIRCSWTPGPLWLFLKLDWVAPLVADPPSGHTDKFKMKITQNECLNSYLQTTGCGFF